MLDRFYAVTLYHIKGFGQIKKRASQEAACRPFDGQGRGTLQEVTRRRYRALLAVQSHCIKKPRPLLAGE